MNIDVLSSFEENRNTSSFGLSIATGLAFETLFEPTTKRIDNERIPPERVNLNTFQNVIINVGSIAQSILESFKFKDYYFKFKNLKELCGITLINEMRTIDGLIGAHSRENVNYKLIVSEYNKFVSRYSNSIKKESDMFKTETYIYMMKYFVSNYDQHNNFILESPILKNTLIYTNRAIDLVPLSRSDDNRLLERHTGTLKPPVKFSTKYLPIGTGKFNMLPFKERFIYLLGDRYMFKPILSIKERRELLTACLDSRITPVSTDDRLHFVMKTKVPDVYKQYKKIHPFYILPHKSKT